MTGCFGLRFHTAIVNASNTISVAIAASLTTQPLTLCKGR